MPLDIPAPTPEDLARDLEADYALCERCANHWGWTDVSAEAPEGWPAALRLLAAAQERVLELEAEAEETSDRARGDAFDRGL